MKQFLFAPLFLLTLLLVEPVMAQQNTTTVKITDSKLAPINMGLDSAEHWIEQMKAGDSTRARTILSDLEKLATRFNRLPKSDDEQYQFIAQRFGALVTELQDKAQTKQPETSTKTQHENSTADDAASQRPHRNLFPLSRQLDSIEAELASGKGEFDQRTLRVKIENAQDLFSEIPVSRHPDYQSVKLRLQTVLEKVGMSAKGDGETEDFEALLTSMRKKYQSDRKLPRAQRTMSTLSLSVEDVQYFVGGIAEFTEDLDSDLPKIKQAVLATGKGSDLSSWLENEIQKEIETQTSRLVARIDSVVERAIVDAKHLTELDVEKNRYSFATDSVVRVNRQKFDRAIETIRNAKALEKQFDLGERWTSKLAQLESDVDLYVQMCGQATSVKELPKEVGTAKQREIALQVLSKEDYGVGEITKLVVNSKITERDRIDTRFFNSRLETTVREWEEFQVVTIEREGAESVVYYNLLRKFSRGDATTPIDRWILADRFLKGNFVPDEK